MRSEVLSFTKRSLAPFKNWIAGMSIVSIIWAIDVSLRPYLIKVMIDRMPGIHPAQAFKALTGPIMLYTLLSILMVIVLRFHDYVALRLIPPLKKHISLELIERMMKHSHNFYQNQFSGGLGNKIRDVMSGIPDILKMIIDQFFAQFMGVFIASMTFWYVNWRFALAFSIWATLFVVVSLRSSKKAQRLSDAASECRSGVIGTIVDILTNMMAVRLFTGKRAEKKRLEGALNTYVKADQASDWFFMKIFFFQGASFVVYQIFCLFWLIQGFRDGIVTSGDFALVLSINITIIDYLWSLSRDVGRFAELLGNVNQGLRLILSPIEIKDKPNAKALVVTDGEIVFDKVQFHYKGAEPLFEDKSVTIYPYQKVGLVGYSGSGKTTFINLILRLFDVTGGRILIDGQDIRDVTQDSLRAAIATIPQDPSLFHESLMENIRYGKITASDGDVMRAAKKAHAHEFIEALPEGYNTLVGERGVKISGGQRQRIAIARAVLKDAPILILDEATSQLDSLTESDIQDSLWDLMENKTTLVVAHRLSTLLYMDRIIVFDQGEIVQDGSHQELVLAKGLYKTLWDAQVGGFLPEKI